MSQSKALRVFRSSGVVILLVCLVCIFLFVWGWPADLNANDIQLWFAQAPDIVVLLVLLVAPLLGFPLSLLLVAVGVVMPLSIALFLTAFTLFIHHVLVLWLSKTSMCAWLRKKLIMRRLLSVSRKQSDSFDNLFFIFAATWIPGISYIFKLIYVAMADLPLRTFFIASTCSQLIAALPYLLLGKVAGEGRFIWVGVVIFAIILCGWLIKMRVLHGRRPQA